MNQYPVAHLPDDFSVSRNPKALYVSSCEVVCLDDVFVLNNASFLQISRVSDLLSVFRTLHAKNEQEQSLFSTLQFAAELLNEVISAEKDF